MLRESYHFMAILADMNVERYRHDEHENDLVMPGFRFHPTEEELLEFYLRRKIEGKHFNVELITFLDLYHYDPWELPALAAIGEKEWFFYVPRDRKYRNGDRPNRVTSSGYWKATGADRMIKSENSRQIGLKKTLVFYSGKAPKGIRSNWIMNEYRLPHQEIYHYQKAEISLCRVYQRVGTTDHLKLPSSLSSKTSIQDINDQETLNFQAFEAQSFSTSAEKLNEPVITSFSVPRHTHFTENSFVNTITSQVVEEDEPVIQMSSETSLLPSLISDELQRLVDYQHSLQQPKFLSETMQSESFGLNLSNNSMIPILEKLWDWNTIVDADGSS